MSCFRTPLWPSPELPNVNVGSMLEKFSLRTGHWLGQASRTSVGSFVLPRIQSRIFVQLAIFGAFSILSTVVLWPIFGRDFPPGVDSPTFLHLAWVTKLAVSGQLSDPFTDPYWYNGFPYMVSYPPLGYGLVGLIGAIPSFSIIVVYQIVLVMAIGGVGICTYWLAREFGLTWWSAALAAVLTVIAYPTLSAIFLWGWFPSVLALPPALLAVTFLERAVRTNNWRPAAWGGLSLGICALVHHMTGAAFAMTLVGWFAFQLAFGHCTRGRATLFFVLFGAITALVVLPWGIPFLLHILDVDFQREIPGNWLPAISTYRSSITNRDLIGSFVYPSYLVSWPILGLAIGAIIYSLKSKHRVAGATTMLLFLTWFSMGEKANPLIQYYPFSGLDVARFPLYMIPFIALLAGWLVDTAVTAAGPLQARLTSSRWPRLWPAAIALLLVGILALPVQDMVKARGNMDSYHVDKDMAAALDWLSIRSAGDEGTSADRLYCVGCWNWDAFLIPYTAKTAIVDGWADEGAPNVELVRPLRHISWNFGRYQSSAVDGQEVHHILTRLRATHVLLAPYYPLEDTKGFEREFQAHPELFGLRKSWGALAMYEVLSRPQVTDGGRVS